MPIDPEENRRFAGLMRQAQEGDRFAYDALLRDIASRSTLFLQKRLGSAVVIEDLVQDILVSIHVSRHTYDPVRPFFPWMYAIVRRRLADYWRSEWQRLKRDTGEPDGNMAEAAVPEAPLSEAVGLAIDELPERQRTVVTLLKVNGYSLKEVAGRLNMTESAIKVTAHRAYSALRKKLTAMDTYENE